MTEVVVPPEIRVTKRRPRRWLILSIVAGILLVGGGVLVVWKLMGKEAVTPLALGEPCGSDPARSCGKGLLCATGVQKCLLPGGAGCTQADVCASGECEANLCAIPLGGVCTPGGVPCPRSGTCDPIAKTCVSRAEAPCEAGAQQCSSDGAAVRTCGNDGTWKTDPCSPSTPQCRDGKCQCLPNKGKACNCGGIIQCNGTCSAAPCSGSCRNDRCCISSNDPACNPSSPVRKRDFNAYILRAIDLVYQDYRGKGYDINSAYTHDLDYSNPREIKAAPRPPATMCVAAVAEVIIAALKLYADETHDRSVFDKLPAESWMRARRKDIRPYIFVYKDFDSNGTADALRHFGIGEHRPFSLLAPGDFIGFNRESGTGHAVIFLGFLNASGQIVPQYDSGSVVGFKYFSAQGTKPPNAGFGYKWAYFSGHCPESDPTKPRDCGVIRSDKQSLLNTGYMLHPTQWSTERALRELRTRFIEIYRLQILSERLRRSPTERDLSLLPPADSRQLEAEAIREFSRELPATTRLNFDGKTTDD